MDVDAALALLGFKEGDEGYAEKKAALEAEINLALDEARQDAKTDSGADETTRQRLQGLQDERRALRSKVAQFERDQQAREDKEREAQMDAEEREKDLKDKLAASEKAVLDLEEKDRRRIMIDELTAQGKAIGMSDSIARMRAKELVNDGDATLDDDGDVVVNASGKKLGAEDHMKAFAETDQGKELLLDLATGADAKDGKLADGVADPATLNTTEKLKLYKSDPVKYASYAEHLPGEFATAT